MHHSNTATFAAAICRPSETRDSGGIVVAAGGSGGAGDRTRSFVADFGGVEQETRAGAGDLDLDLDLNLNLFCIVVKFQLFVGTHQKQMEIALKGY